MTVLAVPTAVERVSLCAEAIESPPIARPSAATIPIALRMRPILFRYARVMDDPVGVGGDAHLPRARATGEHLAGDDTAEPDALGFAQVRHPRPRTRRGADFAELRDVDR